MKILLNNKTVLIDTDYIMLIIDLKEFNMKHDYDEEIKNGYKSKIICSNDIHEIHFFFSKETVCEIFEIINNSNEKKNACNYCRQKHKKYNERIDEIKNILKENPNCSYSESGKRLGVTRQSIYYFFKKYGLKIEKDENIKED